MIRFGKRKQDRFEMEIEHVLQKMQEVSPDSPQYAQMAKNLAILYSAKSKVKDKGISPDTIAIVVGNLAGIGLILGFETIHVLSSKAIGFVMKGRV